MYNRRTKIFFGFMVIVMGIGYPLLLLSNTSAFQGLMGNSTSGSGQTEKLVKDARTSVRKHDCEAAAKSSKRVTKSKVDACTEDLRKLGSGYLALAAPVQQDDGTVGDVPADADDNIAKAVEAYKLWQQIAPTDEDADRALASAYANSNSFDKAEAIYAKLTKANPDDGDTQYQYGILAYQAKDNATALQVLKAYAKAFPDDQNAEQAKELISAINEASKPGASNSLPAGVTVK